MQMQCAICGQEIDSKPLAEYKEYKLYHCKTCDAMFWHPMKGIEAQSYDADDIAGALSWLELTAVSWRHSRFLQNPPAKGRNLLEVGCSTGEFLIMAQNAGYSVTGIDYSQGATEFARSQFGLKEVYPYTMEQLISQKPDVKYDVIVFFEVLEHLDNVPGFMDSVRKLLKPGGFVALSVPNRERWRFSSEKFFRPKWDLPPNHLTRWNIPALVNLFTSYGFSALSVEVEAFKALDHDWSNCISDKLGINPLAEKICRKAIGQSNSSSATPRRFNLRKTITRYAGMLYLKAFFPFLGMITLPLRALLMKQGNSIYLLASLKNQREG